MSSDGCGAQAGPGSSAQSPSNEADPGSPSNLASLKPMLEVVGLIAAPLSIVTSVLVYFGIVGAQVEANFFGLDPADYNYSNQEHISRSIAPMLGPLAMAGAAIAVGIQANSLAARKADHIAASARLQHVAAWALHLGIVSIVFGAAWQWRLGSRHSYWAPIFMGVGGIASAGARGVLNSSVEPLTGPRGLIAGCWWPRSPR